MPFQIKVYSLVSGYNGGNLPDLSSVLIELPGGLNNRRWHCKAGLASGFCGGQNLAATQQQRSWFPTCTLLVRISSFGWQMFRFVQHLRVFFLGTRKSWLKSIPPCLCDFWLLFAVSDLQSWKLKPKTWGLPCGCPQHCDCKMKQSFSMDALSTIPFYQPQGHFPMLNCMLCVSQIVPECLYVCSSNFIFFGGSTSPTCSICRAHPAMEWQTVRRTSRRDRSDQPPEEVKKSIRDALRIGEGQEDKDVGYLTFWWWYTKMDGEFPSKVQEIMIRRHLWPLLWSRA